IKEQMSDEQGLPSSLNQRAMLLMAVGRFPEAVETASRCLAEVSHQGERWLLANYLDTLGLVQLASGDLDAGLGTLLEALSQADTAGDRRLRAQVAVNLGIAHLAAGEVEHAARAAGEAPEPDTGPAVELARLFFEGALALLRTDLDEARRAAAAMSERARRS